MGILWESYGNPMGILWESTGSHGNPREFRGIHENIYGNPWEVSVDCTRPVVLYTVIFCVQSKLHPASVDDPSCFDMIGKYHPVLSYSFSPTCQVRVVRFYVNSRASSFSSFSFSASPPPRLGPQPRPATPSVRCRTSTTTSHAQCSLPDLNHD